MRLCSLKANSSSLKAYWVAIMRHQRPSDTLMNCDNTTTLIQKQIWHHWKFIHSAKSTFRLPLWMQPWTPKFWEKTPTSEKCISSTTSSIAAPQRLELRRRTKLPLRSSNRKTALVTTKYTLTVIQINQELQNLPYEGDTALQKPYTEWHWSRWKHRQRSDMRHWFQHQTDWINSVTQKLTSAEKKTQRYSITH